MNTLDLASQIAAEREVREQLSHCRQCSHDLPAAQYLGFGKWRAFCTECRFEVEANDVAQLNARWAAEV